MKKTYVDVLLEIVELVQDVVTMSSGLNSFEDEQPDFDYLDDPWGGYNL